MMKNGSQKRNILIEDLKKNQKRRFLKETGPYQNKLDVSYNIYSFYRRICICWSCYWIKKSCYALLKNKICFLFNVVYLNENGPQLKMCKLNFINCIGLEHSVKFSQNLYSLNLLMNLCSDTTKEAEHSYKTYTTNLKDLINAD